MCVVIPPEELRSGPGFYIPYFSGPDSDVLLDLYILDLGTCTLRKNTPLFLGHSCPLDTPISSSHL